MTSNYSDPRNTGWSNGDCRPEAKLDPLRENLLRASPQRTHLLDMWVIFMDISPGMDPVVGKASSRSGARYRPAGIAGGWTLAPDGAISTHPRLATDRSVGAVEQGRPRSVQRG